MPGHTIQFMKKYPKIFGKGEILKLTDGVFNKLYRLIDELLALFCHWLMKLKFSKWIYLEV